MSNLSSMASTYYVNQASRYLRKSSYFKDRRRPIIILWDCEMQIASSKTLAKAGTFCGRIPAGFPKGIPRCSLGTPYLSIPLLPTRHVNVSDPPGDNRATLLLQSCCSRASSRGPPPNVKGATSETACQKPLGLGYPRRGDGRAAEMERERRESRRRRRNRGPTLQ